MIHRVICYSYLLLRAGRGNRKVTEILGILTNYKWFLSNAKMSTGDFFGKYRRLVSGFSDRAVNIVVWHGTR